MSLAMTISPGLTALSAYAPWSSRTDTEPAPWQFEHWEFIAILALLALQVLLIAILLRKRSELKRVQAGLHTEIREKKAAEQALLDLGGRLITAQEAERTRIASELHDDMSQRLALLSAELEQLAQWPSATATKMDVCLREALERTRDISRDVVRLAYDLHSSKLDRLGLVSASMSLCREISAQRNLQVEFTSQDIPDSIPPEVALCLYRVLQESLNNFVKHSGIGRAQVELIGAGAGLRLSISDQGAGFDTGRPKASWGLGLISMRERLRLIGGELAIDSQPQRGTRLHASVPLPTAPGQQ